MKKEDKQALLHVQLKKFGDNLIYVKSADEILYKQFLESLGENQRIDVFYESIVDSGTLAQIAKIKVCIRELAKETGNTFEDMQIEIKKASGLCTVREIDGEKYMICKSFADCSKSDLSLTIQTLIQRGEFLGLNFN